MTLAAFLSAILGLLLTPGPTNTLMGLAGASTGFLRAMRLIPAELLGYMTAILPLAFVGHGLMAHYPLAGHAIKLAAAAWVMFLAIKLWDRGPLADAGGEVTAWRICLTTMLNPKALIIGLVLLPPLAAPEFLSRLALFCLVAAGVAMIWGGTGALARQGGSGTGRLRAVRRAASVWLAMVSVMLVAGVVRP